MTESRGAFIIFVLSSRPPSPASSITISHCSRLKYSIPIAVISSNSVGFCSILSACGCINSTSSERAVSGISFPFMHILSLKRLIYGEVNLPTLSPHASRMPESIEQKEPLPFVPATWIKRSLLCGSPICSSSSLIR